MFKRSVSIRAKLLLILMVLFLLSIPTSSQINNCCSVDRECATDAEWVSGYYAFRNSQCAADSQQQANQARSGQTEPQSNNCCFNGWQCSTADDWTSGYWAFRNDQCGAQAQGHHNNNNNQGQPHTQNDDQQNQGRGHTGQWVSVVLGPTITPGPIEHENGSNIEIIIQPIRLSPEDMCAKFPQLDYCQYPESYPEIWD